jgi:hypothetical protein
VLEDLSGAPRELRLGEGPAARLQQAQVLEMIERMRGEG